MILPYVLATLVYIPVAFHSLSKGQDIPYSYVKLRPTELLAGYDKKTEKPLIVDMLSVPHLLVTGLSGQGKSRMLRAMLLNIKDANIVVCNAFKNDYKGVQARFINGEDNVKTYIKNTSTDLHRRDIPLYIVLEELGTIKNKDTIKYIQELLWKTKEAWICFTHRWFIFGEDLYNLIMCYINYEVLLSPTEAYSTEWLPLVLLAGS